MREVLAGRMPCRKIFARQIVHNLILRVFKGFFHTKIFSKKIQELLVKFFLSKFVRHVQKYSCADRQRHLALDRQIEF
jgi:hypothetical protein